MKVTALVLASLLGFYSFEASAANVRVTAINYVSPANAGLAYIPRLAQYATNGTYNVPTNTTSGMSEDMTFDLLNSGTGYYDQYVCSFPLGASIGQICPAPSQVCISCGSAFRTLVWGVTTTNTTPGVRSIGPCSLSHSGLYWACGVQDANSTLAGYGLPAPTGDPGIGGDMHIDIFNQNFTAFWQIDSTVCATYCGNSPSSPGLAGNGTRVVPVGSNCASPTWAACRGGWFAVWGADDTRIMWSNVVGFVQTDAFCSANVSNTECTEVESITWSPGSGCSLTSACASFNSCAGQGTQTGGACGATVTSVNFAEPASMGGIICSSTSGPGSTPGCLPNSPQYGYEVEHGTPNPLQFLVATFSTLYDGNPAILDFTPPGSAKLFMPYCEPPTATNCHWNEHAVMSPDGQTIVISSTYATGPFNGEPSASPLFYPATYPVAQELFLLDPHNPVIGSTNTGAIGGIALTHFNTPGSPEFVSNAGGIGPCHVGFAGVEWSADGRYIMANMQGRTGQNTGCTGAHGMFGYSFMVLSLQPESLMLGGATLTNGAYVE